MLELMRRSPKAFALAVGMHLVLVFFLVVGVDWLVQPKVVQPVVDVVQAKVIDEKAIAAEAARLKQEQDKRKAAEQAKKDKAEKELRELQKKQQQEQQRLKEIEQQRKAAERKRVEAEKARKLEEQKKKQAEVERQKREAAAKQREAEAKKREEAQKKAEADKRAKAEAERKRRAEEDRLRREADLKEAMEAEQNLRAATTFGNAVASRIRQNWIRPLGSDQGLTCKLNVRFSATGTVIAVRVAQSSGNDAFDRSAEAAVYKSDPLPAPPAGLREINFIFDPDAQ